MIKKYLITGGSGFIGRAIALSLLKKKNKVIIADNKSRNKNYQSLEHKNLKIFNFDIRNKNYLKKISKNVDAVIHLAFINGTNYFYEKPDLVLDVAIKGILNVLEVCEENLINEFYLASSSEVYQNALKVPTDEKVALVIPDPLNPRYSYAAGKIISEMMVLNSKLFKKSIIFRPHNIYGPDMGYNHVIPEISYKILKSGNTLNIQGDGTHTRSFCYISDFVNAFNILLTKGKHKNIYNIGTTEEVKIIEVVNHLIKISKKKLIIKKSVEKIGSAFRRCPDISKIKKIGFKPKVKLKEGLIKTYDWYKKDILNDL